MPPSPTVREHALVCASGYFDPLHAGHVEYLKDAKALGDKLVVILNRDDQRRAGTRMAQESRKAILESVRWVDSVVLSVDDGPSVADTLRLIRPSIFAKGGAASPEELLACGECGIDVVHGVGSALHLQDIQFGW